MVALFSRWEAVIIYAALVAMSLRFIKTTDALGRATVAWLSAELVIGTYILVHGGPVPSEWLDAIRLLRVIAGGILIAELARMAFRQALDGSVWRFVLRWRAKGQEPPGGG